MASEGPTGIPASNGPTSPSSETLASPAPSIDQPVHIDGKQYSPNELEELRKDLLKSYYRKTEEVANERKALEPVLREEIEAELRAELEAQYAAQTQAPANSDFSAFDDIAPGTGKALADLNSTVLQIKEALQSKYVQENQSKKDEADAKALAQELQSWRNKPFFDEDKVLDFMEANGLGLGQVGIAYNSLWGMELGKAIGEQEAMRRGATAPPIVGNLSISPGFTAPNEAPGILKQIRELRPNEIVNAALKDPRFSNTR